jgi:anti-anti-sigma factor
MNSVKVSDRTCIVEVPREVIDHDETPMLAACARTIPGELTHVILDFSGMERMNGLGASMLVKLSAQARSRGQRILGYSLNEHYRGVFDITGLDRAIRIFDVAAQALLAAGEVPTGGPAKDSVERSAQVQPVDRGNWAEPVSKLKVPDMPAPAVDLNVGGRRPVGPVEGFGQMWQKVYRLRLTGADIRPAAAIQVLKENFPAFQPPENRFYASAAGIRPGEIVLINSSTPGGPIYTGVMVLYADDESFTFATPQGHPESGWVSFSAFEDDGATVVQILGLARASDPVYEIAFRLVGSKVQERTWRHVLSKMADHLGVPPEVDVEKVRADARLLWSGVGNVWYNAQIRSLIYAVGAPVRRMRKPAR